MIYKCQGISPDGGIGCTRPMGHDDRGQNCKNLSTGIEWCSLCDSFGCEHIDTATVVANVGARERRKEENVRWGLTPPSLDNAD